MANILSYTNTTVKTTITVSCSVLEYEILHSRWMQFLTNFCI